MADAKKGKAEISTESLTKLCGLLMRRSLEQEVFISTLRRLLIERGVFSANEFDLLCNSIEGEQAEKHVAIWTNALKAAESRVLQRLFAALKGPKQ